jgi:uncharacterized protein (DUF1778 family)
MSATSVARTAKGSINLRMDAGTRDLIDRAASVTGRSRTDFMIQSARIEAQNVLLDQVIFPLNDEAWDELQAVLEAPPKPNAAMKAAFRKKPLWEK